MKKRTWAILGVSGALLIGSAYSISANTPGYELYKEALKETHQLESSTMNLAFELKDNSHSIFSGESVIKTNRLSKTMEGESTISNELKSSRFEMARQDGKFLIQKNDQDKVYSMKLTGQHPGSEALANEDLREDLEGIVDFLTKKLQRNIETTANGNGSHEISLDVPQKDIPKAVQALASLAYKHSAMMNGRHNGNEESFHDVMPELPELEDNIKIQQVTIAANISADNIIEQQTIGFTLTGEADDGKQHQLTMSFELALSNINNTSVGTIDITGLEIIEYQHPHHQ